MGRGIGCCDAAASGGRVSPDGPHQLAITSTARRQLAEVLPEGNAFAAHEFINASLLADLHRLGKRLMPPLDDRYSARRGTYRVSYRIDDEERVVTVLAVGARSDVYRSREGCSHLGNS